MKKKSSIYKYAYELNGQIPIFGRDNLLFKVINMPTKQHFDNLCINFRLKKFTNRVNICLSVICVNII